MTSALDALLARLEKTVPAGWDLGLDRMRRLLARLGDPHLRVPPPIHVAGTNGKGSTTALLRAILEASGKTVHVYTSPHLVRFAERIRLAGRFVDDDALAQAIERAVEADAGDPITFFELATVAAFELFAETPADVTLLEVGLGGRLDATNVVENRLVSVITPISLDHEKFLGDTLEKIAAEKAGIVERGRPVVSAPQDDAVVAVLERAAARAGERLRLGGRDWTSTLEDGRLVYRSETALLDLPPPRLLGPHQIVNAGCALAALEAAGLLPDAETAARGLLAVDWPARMQRLAAGRLVEAAPADAEIWLDGGHNPGAGEVIAETLADLSRRAPRPLVLVAGMLETKDPIGFFRAFAGLAERVVTVPIDGGEHPGRNPAALAATIRDHAGLAAEPANSVREALERLRRETEGPAPRILICGSLYLASAVLAENGTPPA
ncbi:MAG: bifunctional folylpolyglutamate synthase/dihydrofolate synthase [Hyphomicrobiales bacterium]|nr:bifunctional folylpolyglutamate synthase/dihydrofolate synthase [Hyphomicrobiales bacterium]